MNIALWVVQGLLALVFLMSGSMKAFTPLATMRKKMAGANDLPAAFVRFLGVAELLGVIGLIAPAVTGIQSWLTVAAAVGLVMVSASTFHTARRECQHIGIPLVLLGLPVCVVLGRGMLAQTHAA
jgi:putative oxidoreductase